MVTLHDAHSVSATLAERIHPVAVIVFGSVARTGRGNDLDLLVVIGEDSESAAVGIALRDFYGRFAVDYFVASVDTLTKEFLRGSRFLRLIQKEGKVLYMKEPLKEWVELALEDCRQAKYLLQGGFYRGRYPVEEGLLPLNPPDRENSESAVEIAESFLIQLGMMSPTH